MSHLVLTLISRLSKHALLYRQGKKSFVKCAWTEWVYNRFKPQLCFFFKGFQTLLPTQIFDTINICQQNLYICSNGAHMPCIFTSDEPYTLNYLLKMPFIQHFKMSIRFMSVLLKQFHSQAFITTCMSPIFPCVHLKCYCSACFLTFGQSFHFLPVSARIKFKILLPTYTGLAALQSVLFSARPVRKAHSSTTVKNNNFSPLQELYLYTRKNPYSYTCITNILFLQISRQTSITTSIVHTDTDYTLNLKY